jgi:hypothetical protein
MASHAYEYADAMLAARGTTTDLDAAPAATATKETPTRESDADGTGDTRAAQGPVAWGVYSGDYLVTAFATQEVAASWVHAGRGYYAVPLFTAPPAAGVTLTDAEREVLERLSTDTRESDPVSSGRPWFVTVSDAATLRGLLARTAKEGDA